MRAGVERVDAEAAQAFSGAEGCLSVAAWTYLFYRKHRNIELDRLGIERLLEQPEPSSRDVADIETFAHRKTRILLSIGHAAPLLSSLFARRSMRLTVRETRRYLVNRRGIAAAIRNFLREALINAWRAGERVLLIGHSLGSVIAYDTLWELSHGDGRTDGRVDLFMTLGSPLARPMILRGVRGAQHCGADRFPHNVARWQNFSARGELTALHPRLGPYYGEMVESGLLESLEDVTGFYNHYRDRGKLDVHTSYGYLITRPVAESIAGWLRAADREPAD